MTITLSATTLISDWPGEIERHGLVVLGKRVTVDRENACLVVEVLIAPTSTTGEPIVIDGQAAPGREPAQPDQAPAASTPPRDLRSILANLIQRAAQESCVPKRAFLKGGMRIDVLIRDGQTNLQISRTGQDPSRTEWVTTLKHLPYPAPEVEPKSMVGRDRRRYLSASWPTPTEPQAERTA